MKSASSNENLFTILKLLKQSSNSLTLEDIFIKISSNVSKRTLQRLMLDLIKSGEVSRLGKGPSSRYAVVSSKKNNALHWLILSQKSQKIIEYVTQPLIARHPVSYHIEFLENYIPNQTFYLSRDEIKKLHEIGATDQKDQPIGTFAHDILSKLLIDLSWASSKLEGNTYSRLDTLRLIEFGEEAQGKAFIETQMILNHKEAIKFIVEEIEHININKQTILNLHGLLSEGLLPDPSDSGKIRTKIVNISGTTFKPLGIPQLLQEYFSMILEKASIILEPFEQAFFLMVHLPYLQPFIDVNKRVARLAINIPLLKNNYCPLTFIDIPEDKYVQGMLGVYELNDPNLLKDVFIVAYARSAQEYLSIQQSLVPPHPLMIKYRLKIHELVHKVVNNYSDDENIIINEYVKEFVSSEDASDFKRYVNEALELLHEGVLARYRLSFEQFQLWKNFTR